MGVAGRRFFVGRSDFSDPPGGVVTGRDAFGRGLVDGNEVLGFVHKIGKLTCRFIESQ